MRINVIPSIPELTPQMCTLKYRLSQRNKILLMDKKEPLSLDKDYLGFNPSSEHWVAQFFVLQFICSCRT